MSLLLYVIVIVIVCHCYCMSLLSLLLLLLFHCYCYCHATILYPLYTILQRAWFSDGPCRVAAEIAGEPSGSMARNAAVLLLGWPLPQWTRCGCTVHPSRRGKWRRDQGRPQPPMTRPTPNSGSHPFAAYPGKAFPARTRQNTYCCKPVATGYL